MRFMTAKKLIAAILVMVFAAAFVSCSPVNGDKLAKEGKELYTDGNYTDALNSFLSAEEAGLKNFKQEELYSCIGNCYLKLDNCDKSIEYQLKCLDENPEYFEGWVNLGVAYRKSGNNEKAMTCYEVALNYDPKSTESGPLYISLGVLYIELGKPISALTYLEMAQTIYPEQPDIYAYLSIAYAMALEPDKSDTAFETAKNLGYPRMGEIQEQLNKLN